jgi:hypothetical protein
MMEMQGYPLQGYGKMLPPLIVNGYFQAFSAYLGLSGTMACVEAGIAPAIMDADVRWAWLQPSNASVRGLQTYPLDYAQIAPFQGGLEAMMVSYKVANPARQVRGITWNQCAFWWQEYHVPTAVSPDRLSLGRMVRPTVEAYVRAYHQRHGTLPDAMAVLLVAMHTFAHISTIDLGVALQEQQFIITTRDCPFCLNRSDCCYMLFGLVQGAIAWISSLEGMGTAMEQLAVVELPHNNHQVIVTSAHDADALQSAGPGGSG